MSLIESLDLTKQGTGTRANPQTQGPHFHSGPTTPQPSEAVDAAVVASDLSQSHDGKQFFSLLEAICADTPNISQLATTLGARESLLKENFDKLNRKESPLKQLIDIRSDLNANGVAIALPAILDSACRLYKPNGAITTIQFSQESKIDKGIVNAHFAHQEIKKEPIVINKAWRLLELLYDREALGKNTTIVKRIAEILPRQAAAPVKKALKPSPGDGSTDLPKLDLTANSAHGSANPQIFEPSASAHGSSEAFEGFSGKSTDGSDAAAPFISSVSSSQSHISEVPNSLLKQFGIEPEKIVAIVNFHIQARGLLVESKIAQIVFNKNELTDLNTSQKGFASFLRNCLVEMSDVLSRMQPPVTPEAQPNLINPAINNLLSRCSSIELDTTQIAREYIHKQYELRSIELSAASAAMQKEGIGAITRNEVTRKQLDEASTAIRQAVYQWYDQTAQTSLTKDDIDRRTFEDVVKECVSTKVDYIHKNNPLRLLQVFYMQVSSLIGDDLLASNKKELTGLLVDLIAKSSFPEGDGKRLAADLSGDKDLFCCTLKTLLVHLSETKNATLLTRLLQSLPKYSLEQSTVAETLTKISEQTFGGSQVLAQRIELADKAINELFTQPTKLADDESAPKRRSRVLTLGAPVLTFASLIAAYAISAFYSNSDASAHNRETAVTSAKTRLNTVTETPTRQLGKITAQPVAASRQQQEMNSINSNTGVIAEQSQTTETTNVVSVLPEGYNITNFEVPLSHVLQTDIASIKNSEDTRENKNLRIFAYHLAEALKAAGVSETTIIKLDDTVDAPTWVKYEKDSGHLYLSERLFKKAVGENSGYPGILNIQIPAALRLNPNQRNALIEKLGASKASLVPKPDPKPGLGTKDT